MTLISDDMLLFASDLRKSESEQLIPFPIFAATKAELHSTTTKNSIGIINKEQKEINRFYTQYYKKISKL